MTDRDNRALIERYYALVDRGDPDQMLELFTDDCVYERPGTEPLRGREELEAFYRNQRAIDSGAHTLTSVYTNGPAGVADWRFDGRLRVGGDVSPVRRHLRATGRRNERSTLVLLRSSHLTQRGEFRWTSG